MGGTFISGVTANNTVGGALAYQNNGFNVYLIDGTSIALSGNITANPFTGGTAGNINLTTLGTGNTSQSAGNISGHSLSLVSLSSIGAVGAGKNIVTTAPTVTATAGAINEFSSVY